jgi:nucleotidyltransferase/DNA polymerase involved in DNA repair
MRVSQEAESRSDDLKKIEGIGPKVAKVLNAAGITTFEALARANPSEVQKMLDQEGLQMMNPEGWIQQAELAAKGDWERRAKRRKKAVVLEKSRPAPVGWLFVGFVSEQFIQNP